ncbi:hypothetical protein X943_002668 [Babesia divergens]|uniref:Inositol-pentakisphosphate 2-kinase n=1 Tax=Babesia divergens TaxID=32595 RepID=A0AAD9LF63_BABDI|nr:hypothetical protein X943_002668 [Babesia divergens]
MLYHDEFCMFMQEGSRNNGDSCTPKRICCVIDRQVAKKLRNHLSKLLDCKHNSDYPYHTSIHADNAHSCASTARGKLFHNGVVYKKRIYHVEEVALQTSIDVNPRSIRILNHVRNLYDPQKHELAILEEDMFNLAVCVALGRTLLQNGMQKYRNISVELKPKCGLLNFSGMPSLFQMSQPYKSRIRYRNIISTGELPESIRVHEDIDSVKVSKYSPIKFFSMRLEGVKKELWHLSQVPQNNMRIFIDNVEVDPALLCHDAVAMETIAHCLVENRRIVAKILRIQALASGQQIVAHMVYYLSRLVTRFSGIRKMEPNTKQCKLKISSIAWNLLQTSRDVLQLTLCDYSDPYEIQRMFNLIGRRWICTLSNMLENILETSGMTFYTTRKNLSVNRITANRENHDKSLHAYNPICIAKRELAMYAQGQLFHCERSDDEAIQLVMYDKLERMLETIERSCYQESAISRLHGGKILRGKLKYGTTNGSIRSRSTNLGCRSHNDRIKRQQSHILRSCNRWIELYLGGRTAMDLSIVLNVLFQDAQRKGEKGPNFFRFSLIDLDLKPAHRIPRWKDDVMFVIQEQKIKVEHNNSI